MLSLRVLSSTLLGLLYPATCAACDQPIADSASLCPLCFDSCEAIAVACPTCARPLAGPRSIPCAACLRSRPTLSSCTACFEYGGQLAVALRRLKFNGRNDIGRTLMPLLADRFRDAKQGCDLAIPIPLHPSRLRSRGYNQALRLLAPLARQTGIPVARTLLRRTRATPPQSQLARAKRQDNLRDAFRAGVAVAHKSVLLVDDIRTTGATLDAAARALKRAGASEIHAFVVARTEWEG